MSAQPSTYGEFRRQLSPGAFALICCAAALLPAASLPAGNEPAPANTASADNFQTLLEHRTRGTMQAVASYIAEHPSAADRDAALRWLFTAAREHHLPQLALPAATSLLEDDNASASLKPLALTVRCLGRAAAGDSPGALDDFDLVLRSVSLRSPQPAIDLATDLSARLQLAGDLDAALAMYERLSSRFFLNSYVRGLCAQRTARLSLAGKQAPEVSSTTTAGDSIDLADFEGKVLLVDFWATNCAPCLVEFPGMKQLYAQHHEAGFEVLGLSLDENSELVDAFREKQQLPWTMSLSSTDNDATRQRYRVETIPAMYLVDRTGKIALVDIRGGLLKIAIEQLLAPATPEQP